MDPVSSGTIFRIRDPTTLRSPAPHRIPLHALTTFPRPASTAAISHAYDDDNDHRAHLLKPQARRQYDAIASPIFHGNGDDDDDDDNQRTTYSFSSFPPPAPSPPSTTHTLSLSHTHSQPQPRASAPPLLLPHASPATGVRLLPTHVIQSPRPPAPTSIPASFLEAASITQRFNAMVAASPVPKSLQHVHPSTSTSSSYPNASTSTSTHTSTSHQQQITYTEHIRREYITTMTNGVSEGDTTEMVERRVTRAVARAQNGTPEHMNGHTVNASPMRRSPRRVYQQTPSPPQIIQTSPATTATPVATTSTSASTEFALPGLPASISSLISPRTRNRSLLQQRLIAQSTSNSPSPSGARLQRATPRYDNTLQHIAPSLSPSMSFAPSPARSSRSLSHTSIVPIATTPQQQVMTLPPPHTSLMNLSRPNGISRSSSMNSSITSPPLHVRNRSGTLPPVYPTSTSPAPAPVPSPSPPPVLKADDQGFVTPSVPTRARSRTTNTDVTSPPFTSTTSPATVPTPIPTVTTTSTSHKSPDAPTSTSPSHSRTRRTTHPQPAKYSTTADGEDGAHDTLIRLSEWGLQPYAAGADASGNPCVMLHGHRALHGTWTSAQIVSCDPDTDDRLVTTASGVEYILVGRLHIPYTRKYYGDDVIDAFRTGFPSNWREILTDAVIQPTSSSSITTTSTSRSKTARTKHKTSQQDEDIEKDQIQDDADDADGESEVDIEAEPVAAGSASTSTSKSSKFQKSKTKAKVTSKPKAKTKATATVTATTTATALPATSTTPAQPKSTKSKSKPVPTVTSSKTTTASPHKPSTPIRSRPTTSSLSTLSSPSIHHVEELSSTRTKSGRVVHPQLKWWECEVAMDGIVHRTSDTPREVLLDSIEKRKRKREREDGEDSDEPRRHVKPKRKISFSKQHTIHEFNDEQAQEQQQQQEEEEEVVQTKKRTKKYGKKRTHVEEEEDNVKEEQEEEEEEVVQPKKRAKKRAHIEEDGEQDTKPAPNSTKSPSSSTSTSTFKSTSSPLSSPSASSSWSPSRIQSLRIAHASVLPSAPNFWRRVASALSDGATGEECQHQWESQFPTPKIKQKTKRRANIDENDDDADADDEKDRLHALESVLRGRGELKRKRLMREIIAQHNQQHEDDIFESTPYKQKYREEEDETEDEDEKMETTAAKKMAPTKPAKIQLPSTSSSTSFSPSRSDPLLAPVDRHAADSYVNKLKNQTTRVKPKVSTSRNNVLPSRSRAKPIATATTALPASIRHGDHLDRTAHTNRVLAKLKKVTHTKGTTSPVSAAITARYGMDDDQSEDEEHAENDRHHDDLEDDDDDCVFSDAE